MDTFDYFLMGLATAIVIRGTIYFMWDNDNYDDDHIV